MITNREALVRKAESILESWHVLTLPFVVRDILQDYVRLVRSNA